MIGLSFLRNYPSALVALQSSSNSVLFEKFLSSLSSYEYEKARWMVNTLAERKQRYDSIAILGSSFSTYLVPMLCTRMAQINNIILYDRNEQAMDIARTLHYQIRSDVKIDYCVMDVEEGAARISDSMFDLVAVPYAESLPNISSIRTKINKAIYAVQGEVGERLRDEKDLLVSSGCIQQVYRGVEKMAGKPVAMIVGSKRV